MNKPGVVEEKRLFHERNKRIFRENGNTNHSSHNDQEGRKDNFCGDTFFHEDIEPQIMQ
jgi:hypothetical protein